MSHTYRNNKNSNDNTAPAKVIRSPDGTEIQITAGRKLQVIRSFASDPEITDAQFRTLVCIVDRLNEGKEDTDEGLWGSAYPKFETLAKDIAKDERAAKRIVKELETGQRQTRSNGVTKLVPCKSVLSIKRSKDEDDRDEVNEYRLKEWGAFAVGKGAVTCKEECGHLQGRVRSPATRGAVTAPDSSHPPSSEKHLTNPPQLAPACGEHGPAGGLIAGDDAQRQKGANDNVKQDDPDQNAEVAPWPVDMYQRFMDIYPRGGSPMKVKKELDRIEREGRTDYRIILKGTSNYMREKKGTQSQFISDPANFLRNGDYEGYQKEPSSIYKRNVAI
ncbi:hypothetical protein IVA93_02915 [Bradyrhizobium sp. 155]|uniref:helix-turn-helix domain-containing protein n=1 Tax=Bradyrhizobium sp. 155 TaxID=2782629 RepID=UPI001FFE4252|nr:helix-turn-helix domain-containing protein [Bradyrhizobium sp. 155]UPK12191.1 hypothetical protein IVA93_02915 [Bradyrhizobium sp. 155]